MTTAKSFWKEAPEGQRKVSPQFLLPLTLYLYAPVLFAASQQSAQEKIEWEVVENQLQSNKLENRQGATDSNNETRHLSPTIS